MKNVTFKKNVPNKKLRKRNLRNAHLVVVRYNSAGELKNSKPCTACLELIIHEKIKWISYSDNNGQIVTMRPQDIVDTIASSGNSVRPIQWKFKK